MKIKKISRFLAIGICAAVLVGCSTNEERTADTSVTESKDMQSIDTETSSERSSVTSEAINSSDSKLSDSQNSTVSESEVTNDSAEQEESTELTTEEASKKVLDYLKEQKGYELEGISVRVEEEKEEGKYTIQAFSLSAPGGNGEQATATIGWYLVDKITGDVEEEPI